MRPWFALLLALSSHVRADDLVARFRRSIEKNPPLVTWSDNSYKPSSPMKSTYAGPGLIRFTRMGGDRQVYEPKVMEYLRLPIARPLRVRSASCAGVPRILNCRLDLTYPSLTVGIFAAGQAAPKRTQDLNSQVLSIDILKAYLPELVPPPLTMTCDDWSWAKNEDSGLIEFIEVAEVRDARALDVDISQRGQAAVGGDFTCAATPGVPCALAVSADRGNEVQLLFADSISLELNKRHACTVEFEAATPPNPDNIFTLIRVSAQRRQVNPAAYATFQPRFTAPMLDDLIRDQFRLASSGRRAIYDVVRSATNLVMFEWLDVFGAISVGGNASDRRVENAQVQDRIEEGDRP